jgi:acyl-CoA thioester hydrolase
VYEHLVRVRYSECDAQGVVFNGNYLAYVDDVMDRWLADALGRPEVSGFTAATETGFDYMVKKVVVEWFSPARHGDELALSAKVVRWGNASFDVAISGVVGDRPVFDTTLTGVCVTPGTASPARVPEEIRQRLSDGVGAAASGPQAAQRPHRKTSLESAARPSEGAGGTA